MSNSFDTARKSISKPAVSSDFIVASNKFAFSFCERLGITDTNIVAVIAAELQVRCEEVRINGGEEVLDSFIRVIEGAEINLSQAINDAEENYETNLAFLGEYGK